jgi:hypothetical protein
MSAAMPLCLTSLTEPNEPATAGLCGKAFLGFVNRFADPLSGFQKVRSV